MEIKENHGFYIGLDLASLSDFTGICILQHVRYVSVDEHAIVRDPSQAPPLDEPAKPAMEPSRDEFHVRHIERVRMNYVDQIAHLKTRITQVAKETPNTPDLVVDETGVGRPIVDMLRAENVAPIIPVTITGGMHVTKANGSWHVPKRDLASTIKALLGTDQLKIVEGQKHSNTLQQELQNFRVKVNMSSGHDSYEAGAWRENPYDDLVLSTALACWWAVKKTKKTGRTILPIQVGVNEGRWSKLSGFRDGVGIR
jgi:hypothetical protein